MITWVVPLPSRRVPTGKTSMLVAHFSLIASAYNGVSGATERKYPGCPQRRTLSKPLG